MSRFFLSLSIGLLAVMAVGSLSMAQGAGGSGSKNTGRPV